PPARTPAVHLEQVHHPLDPVAHPVPDRRRGAPTRRPAALSHGAGYVSGNHRGASPPPDHAGRKIRRRSGRRAAGQFSPRGAGGEALWRTHGPVEPAGGGGSGAAGLRKAGSQVVRAARNPQARVMSAHHGNVVPAPVSVGVDRPLRRGCLWLGSLAAAYVAAFAFYPRLFFAIGVNHYDAWFLDTFALLASNDAVSRGLDPYAPNPLDYFHRPHVYSHWWLHLRDLGLTRADVMWLGLTLVGTFLCAALWRLRPQTLRPLLWDGAVLCSSPVLLALDRGNNDLAIFVLLTPVVPCLLSGRPAWRLAAPFLVTAAAMLKYYPAAAALVLLPAPDARELRSRLVLTLLLLLFAGHAEFWRDKFF